MAIFKTRIRRMGTRIRRMRQTRLTRRIQWTRRIWRIQQIRLILRIRRIQRICRIWRIHILIAFGLSKCGLLILLLLVAFYCLPGK